jgi:hypothetical protein
MLTIVGSRFKGGELVGIYAVMGMTWGLGALLGPALAGIAALRSRRLPPLRPVHGDIQARNLRPPALCVTHEWTGAGRLVIAIPSRRTAPSGRVAGDK